MKINFTRDLYDIFQDAASEALRTGYTLIGVDHVMLALLRRKGSPACRLLRSMGIDCAEMKDYIDSVIFRPEALPYDALESIRPGRDADKLLCISIYEAIKAGDTAVRPVHVVLGHSPPPLLFARPAGFRKGVRCGAGTKNPPGGRRGHRPHHGPGGQFPDISELNGRQQELSLSRASLISSPTLGL